MYDPPTTSNLNLSLCGLPPWTNGSARTSCARELLKTTLHPIPYFCSLKHELSASAWCGAGLITVLSRKQSHVSRTFEEGGGYILCFLRLGIWVVSGMRTLGTHMRKTDPEEELMMPDIQKDASKGNIWQHTTRWRASVHPGHYY